MISLCHNYVINVHTLAISPLYIALGDVGKSWPCKIRIQCNKGPRMAMTSLHPQMLPLCVLGEMSEYETPPAQRQEVGHGHYKHSFKLHS